MKHTMPMERLVKGKNFHKKIQNDWKSEAEGTIKAEHCCVKPSGRKGRMDIHAEMGSKNRLVSCVEIKNTNWDKIDKKRIAIYANKQAKQVWDYIESELKRGKDVSPGIIFPKRPKNKNRMLLVEKLFEESGIPVVWDDETMEERRSR